MGFGEEGTSMNECPLCGQATSKASARLIRDECGHFKCRMCLLQEENGCTICNNEANNQSLEDNSKIHSIGNFDYQVPESNMPSLDDADCTTDGTDGLVVNKLNHNNPYDSLFDVALNEEVQSTQDEKAMDPCGLSNDDTNGIDELLNGNSQFMEKQPVVDKFENLQIGKVTSTITYNQNAVQQNTNQAQTKLVTLCNTNGSNKKEADGKSNGSNLLTPIQQITNQLQANPLIHQQIISKLPKPVGSGPACRIILLRIVTNQNKNAQPGLLPIQIPALPNDTKNALNNSNLNNIATSPAIVKNQSRDSITNTKTSEYDLSDFLLFKDQNKSNTSNNEKKECFGPSTAAQVKTNKEHAKVTNKTVAKSNVVIINNTSSVIKSTQQNQKCAENSKSLDMPSIDDNNEESLGQKITGSKNYISKHNQNGLGPSLSIKNPDCKNLKAEGHVLKASSNVKHSLTNETASNLLSLASVASFMDDRTEKNKPQEKPPNLFVKLQKKLNNHQKEEKMKKNIGKAPKSMEIKKNKVPEDETINLKSNNQMQDSVRRGNRERKPKKLLYEDDVLKIRFKSSHKEEKTKKNNFTSSCMEIKKVEDINKCNDETKFKETKTRMGENVVNEISQAKKEDCVSLVSIVTQVRKRGRPKKTDAERAATAKKTLNENPVKRSPGRPRRDWSHILEQSDGTYKCSGCLRIFGRYNSKVYHGICSPTQPVPKFNYKCEECNRYFATKQHYLYHYRGHTGDRPYKCSECKKGFRTKGKLNRHLMCHKDIFDVECNECGKKFNCKDNLKVHLTVHSRVRYRCKYCPSSYTFEHNRKRHEERHTSTDWFKCEICGKTFRTKFLMRRHLKVHGPAKLFSCEHCTRLFMTRFALQRHVVSHFAEKPLSCKTCGEGFRRSDNLARHVKFHHENEECNIDENNTDDKKVDSLSDQIEHEHEESKRNRNNTDNEKADSHPIQKTVSINEETIEHGDKINPSNSVELDKSKSESESHQGIDKTETNFDNKNKTEESVIAAALPAKRPRGRPKKVKRNPFAKKELKKDDVEKKLKPIVDTKNLTESMPTTETVALNQNIENPSCTESSGLNENDSSDNAKEQEDKKIELILNEEDEAEINQHSDSSQELELVMGEDDGLPQHWRRRTAESLKPKKEDGEESFGTNE